MFGTRTRFAVRERKIEAAGLEISTLAAGKGPDVLLLHGLGGTKASFAGTLSSLSTQYRVHALDLPGFGASSKPLTAPYNARWFADSVLALMDELEIERAHLVGNSLGGRIALEIGMNAPQRIGGLALLCPAVAFIKRSYLPVVRLLRPELGVLPHSIGRARVTQQLLSLFADQDGLDPDMVESVVDEFLRIYGSAAARVAFLATARNLYLDEPFGPEGFYERLAGLQPPAMFVWSTHDSLIPAAFARHVAEWLPSADQIVLDTCGHVPQIERPDQTHGLIRRFFARVDALKQPAPDVRRTIAAAA